MDRSNHYEGAFEGYLQWHRLCYVGVDETRRAFLGDRPVKNLDFIVLGQKARLLVDVKGRRFPGGPPGRERRIWECWSTRDDIDGLGRWLDLFGEDYLGLLVFMYQLGPTVAIPRPGSRRSCAGTAAVRWSSCRPSRAVAVQPSADRPWSSRDEHHPHSKSDADAAGCAAGWAATRVPPW